MCTKRDALSSEEGSGRPGGVPAYPGTLGPPPPVINAATYGNQETMHRMGGPLHAVVANSCCLSLHLLIEPAASMLRP
jgi:hypothetical protein